MLVPIRCFTCNKVLSYKWDSYKDALLNGKSAKDALDDLGLHKMCCRSVYLTTVEMDGIV